MHMAVARNHTTEIECLLP